jgi:membrane-bound lytic murein transglycosylase A
VCFPSCFRLSLPFIFLLLLLGGCQSPPPRPSGLDLIPVSYEKLAGWQRDAVIEALPALQRSCSVLLNKPASTPLLSRGDGTGFARDWKPFCQQIVDNPPQSTSALRTVMQNHLKPWQACFSGTCNGFFTGYDEPELRGSLRRQGAYQTPLYRLPDKKKLYKGMTRNRIVKGGLKGRKLELVWVDDPVAAFFLQIQGSGRVKLENGRILRLGYAGTNGCAYYAIGKTLIDRGVLTPQNVSRQTITAWLKAHPRTAESVMSLNKSYVFFQIRHGPGPIGCQGVALTPQRSLAVDKEYISLGTPLWIDLKHPDKNKPHIQSLVVAQDTGGAIKGGGRGDLFWGCGSKAADLAGRMKSSGHYYLLLPK